MKKIVICLLSLLAWGTSIFFTSCNDYLEMPEQTSYNLDSIFKNYQNTEPLIYDLYRDAPFHLWGWAAKILHGPQNSTMTDEGITLMIQSAYTPIKVYAGNVSSTWFTSSKGEDIYTDHWGTIRRAFILMENIDRVPDASTENKERIKAECKTVIALEYFELLKRYGGVPLIKKSLNNVEEYYIVRSSLKDVYDYIILLLDEAIATPAFPAVVPNEKEFGRATKAFAYGLKARTMLYVASPLFNTASPYMDFGDNNKLICFTDYDKNRWKLAADATLDAINFCEASGIALVDKYGENENYRIASSERPKDGNTEIIFAVSQHTAPTKIITFLGRGAPLNGYAANIPTHNQVEKYQNKDGSFTNWDQKITTGPNDPTAPYDNLDPRFHQSIVYNGSVWYSSPTEYRMQIYDGANGASNGANGSTTAKAQFAYFFRKYLAGNEYSAKSYIPLSIYMRLSELYLNYAEAMNEFEGPTEKVFERIDAIRNRSGMPNVPRNLSQGELRDYLDRERSIELYFEGHRYFDLKRKLRGDIFKAPIHDVKVLKYPDNTYTYEKYVYHERAWFDFWYLHPFPYDEVNKGYGLIQNPGW